MRFKIISTYWTQLFFVNNNRSDELETAYTRFLPLSRPISRKICSPLLIAPHLQSRISVSNWPRRLSNKTISIFIIMIDFSYLRPSLHTKPPCDLCLAIKSSQCWTASQYLYYAPEWSFFLCSIFHSWNTFIFHDWFSYLLLFPHVRP